MSDTEQPVVNKNKRHRKDKREQRKLVMNGVLIVSLKSQHGIQTTLISEFYKSFRLYFVSDYLLAA